MWQALVGVNKKKKNWFRNCTKSTQNRLNLGKLKIVFVVKHA